MWQLVLGPYFRLLETLEVLWVAVQHRLRSLSTITCLEVRRFQYFFIYFTRTYDNWLDVRWDFFIGQITSLRLRSEGYGLSMPDSLEFRLVTVSFTLLLVDQISHRSLRTFLTISVGTVVFDVLFLLGGGVVLVRRVRVRWYCALFLMCYGHEVRIMLRIVKSYCFSYLRRPRLLHRRIHSLHFIKFSLWVVIR